MNKSSRTIVIIGANGMFGKDACEIFAASGYAIIPVTKSDLDITDLAKVREFFEKKVIKDHDRCFVINAAAYTKVDDAETSQDLAFKVNSEGAKNVAIVTKEKSIPLVYISTDYVFDGEKGSPYLPSDQTNPINVYGASKLAGEENTRKENPQSYIARTSWLYGKHGKNFVDTMLQIAKTQKVIKVVNDQFGCPTWTRDLAYGIKDLVEKKKPFGIYQICGSKVASWYEFAREIFAISEIDVEVIPVKTFEFPRPAKRPKFSAMDNGMACGEWKESLKKYLSRT